MIKSLEKFTVCLNMPALKRRQAFTFVEMTLSVAISLVVFLMIYRFLSSTRHHYMYGTVNLQNLQEARQALNNLRRDFSCACPRIEDPDIAGYVTLQKVRKQVFVTSSWPSSTEGDLIQIHPHGLMFYKFAFGSTGEKPEVELVSYEFDPVAKVLIRRSKGDRIQKFTGFEDVDFRLYAHRLNPKVPVLWVSFKVHEGENIYGKDSIGKALELTTSITSNFITSSVNNKYWRYEIGHKKL
ncbi:MAG: hypothetical protein PHD82_07325 [Candidatus Riflebacteria bacterium]|jgi:competence protein ComGC|nr:hypothetical protein [Candidatus Riflebacteria bacterium]